MRIRAPLFFFLTLVCVSEIASALHPLVYSDRARKSTDIVTGYVTSIGTQLHANGPHYFAQMIVMKVEKGTNVRGGQTVGFDYQKVPSHPLKTIKQHSIVKVYLRYDESANLFRLIQPNGFDFIHL